MTRCNCGSQAVNVDPDRRECDTCLARRLLAIVDRLPKTADGVAVIANVDHVWRFETFQSEPEQSVGVYTEAGQVWALFGKYSCVPFISCYSTREAAEEARLK